MAPFDWSKDNEVFLPQIDAEHRRLCEAARRLHDAYEANSPGVAEQYANLEKHFEEHFSTEEWLMKTTQYPLYGWHRAQHDTLRRRLKLFGPQLEARLAGAAEVFWEILAGWLEDHAGVSDRMLGAFVR